MKIVVGLGNIGEEYVGTRHNAGFLVLDNIADLNWKEEKKFEAAVARKGEVLFVKPTTYMNESGRAVRKLMDFYKVEMADLVLVHDDLDIRWGEFKVQLGVGPKVHNGVDSVERVVGTKEFLRVRVGVDNREKGLNYGSGADFVLKKMNAAEIKEMNDVARVIIQEMGW